MLELVQPCQLNGSEMGMLRRDELRGVLQEHLAWLGPPHTAVQEGIHLHLMRWLWRRRLVLILATLRRCGGLSLLVRILSLLLLLLEHSLLLLLLERRVWLLLLVVLLVVDRLCRRRPGFVDVDHLCCIFV